MANEAREAAWQAYFTTIKNIPHGPMPYTAFKAGYAAHESAIRAAAVALVEQCDLVEKVLAAMDDQYPMYKNGFNDAVESLRDKLAALKAELETPTGKE